MNCPEQVLPSSYSPCPIETPWIEGEQGNGHLNWFFLLKIHTRRGRSQSQTSWKYHFRFIIHEYGGKKTFVGAAITKSWKAQHKSCSDCTAVSWNPPGLKKVHSIFLLILMETLPSSVWVMTSGWYLSLATQDGSFVFKDLYRYTDDTVHR